MTSQKHSTEGEAARNHPRYDNASFFLSKAFELTGYGGVNERYRLHVGKMRYHRTRMGGHEAEKSKLKRAVG